MEMPQHIHEPITATIVNRLYDEALLLAEEARAEFDFARHETSGHAQGSNLNVALSCVTLRTTTTLMHVMAWLLNHRAFFAGEMSGHQLRQHGRLPPPQPRANPEDLALMDPAINDVIARSVALYDRVERLDQAWADEQAEPDDAVGRLQDRLGKAFASD